MTNTSTTAQLGSCSADIASRIIHKMRAPASNWDSIGLSRAERELIVASLQPATPVEAARARDTYTEICKNPTCPRGGKPVEIVGSAAEAMRDRNLSLDAAQPSAKSETILAAADELHDLGFKAGWNGAIEECKTAVQDLRGRSASDFKDPGCAGQRGEDRCNALYDAYQALQGLTISSTDRAEPGWSAVQFWEYVEGLTDAHVRDQIRDMLSSQGLSVTSQQRAQGE